MTQKLNDDDLAEALRRLEPGDPLPAVDPVALVTRGRRGIRRRRILTSTGTAVLVAAVAVSATLLPDLNSAETPPVAVSPSTTPASSAAVRVPSPYLAAMPGVPYGDAALGSLTNAEATRRCKVRYPNAIGGLDNMLHFRGGLTAMYAKPQVQLCLTPGDSRPTAAGRAWLAVNRLPDDDAGLLLNCSLELWHDIRSWRVVAKDSSPGLITTMVAISPSGRFAALCRTTANGGQGGTGLGIALANPTGDDVGEPTMEYLRDIGTYGSACPTFGVGCTGFVSFEANRTDPEVVKLRFSSASGTHEIAVDDGWYALAWVNAAATRGPSSHLKAFDKFGKVVFQR